MWHKRARPGALSGVFWPFFILNKNIRKIDVYVGEDDGKLHFVDAAGADTALPFKHEVVTIDLPGGNTVSIADKYPDYSKITVDNIFIKSIRLAGGNDSRTFWSGLYINGYNPDTGVVTFYMPKFGGTTIDAISCVGVTLAIVV